VPCRKKKEEALAMSVINMTAPPVVCAGCGREIASLFCVRCAQARLGDADILAMAKAIKDMSRKSPAFKTNGKSDCLLCGRSISAGTMVRRLAKHHCAHAECVSHMRARLDELVPQRKAAPASELPFGDSFLEVD
jgi:hypothetical protein